MINSQITEVCGPLFSYCFIKRDVFLFLVSLEFLLSKIFLRLRKVL